MCSYNKYIVLKFIVIFSFVYLSTAKYDSGLMHYDSEVSEYVVKSAGCEIPNLPPFPVGEFKTYAKRDPIKCTDKRELLTYTTVENGTAFLHINMNAIPEYYPDETMKCCYRYVYRNGSRFFPDNGISITDCYPFNSTVELKHDLVMVHCYSTKHLYKLLWYPTTVYENVHQVIVEKPEFQERYENISHKTAPLSVLFVVLDGVSRLNFIRTMPETTQFIMDNNFVEFKGYNKVHDNTYPNFIAWLTGLEQEESFRICKPRDVGGLDNCPMVWKQFQNAGYVTAYAEDWADISTFNYAKRGFKEPPTDYYFRPYMEATDVLQVQKQDTMPFCTGPETAGSRILNLAKDFTSTFKTKPTFAVFWMNTFSHNYINSTMSMDTVVKQFFEDLKGNGIFDNTMIVLLSDHGVRFGDIIVTPRGFFEERLPMNYISLPKWFKDKHHEKYVHFEENTRKLTSTFDLHMTLVDILKIQGMEYQYPKNGACDNCSSLFDHIPHDRSCLDAGIPEKWCTCLGNFTPITRTDYGLTRLQNDISNALEAIKPMEEAESSILLNEFDASLACDTIMYLQQTTSKPNHFCCNGKQLKYFLVACKTNTNSFYQFLFREKFDTVSELIHERKLYTFL